MSRLFFGCVLWASLSGAALKADEPKAEPNVQNADSSAAEYALGLKYENGTEVPKNLPEALKWFRKSAEGGDARAQDHLGMMYAKGDGLPKDFIEGLAWCNIAAASGLESAVGNRDRLEREVGMPATLLAQQRSKQIVQRIEAWRKIMAESELAAHSHSKETDEQKARAEQVPLSGFEKREGLSEDGKAADGGLLQVVQNGKPQPKPYPRLTDAKPSIVPTRPQGTANAGITGENAHWSQFGEYLAELEEIVVQQWYMILEESHVSPPKRSHVEITFKISSKGETDIIKVEDKGSGKQGVWSCQSAIQARQPYRKWSEKMIAALGDEQTLVFNFYFQ